MVASRPQAHGQMCVSRIRWVSKSSDGHQIVSLFDVHLQKMAM